MEGRSKLHERISDLLSIMENNNNRLSLHEERISQLDIDVLRKQCIELYEQINRLALSGALETDLKVEVSQGDEPAEAELVAEEVVPREEKPQAVEETKTESPASNSAKKAPVEKQVPEDPHPSIHKKLQEEAEMVSLFEKFNSKPIDSIAKAINISKRFEFQNNFFDGDASSYKEFIRLIDEAGDRESAFQVYHRYKDELGWVHEDLKDELKSLLYRKYAT